VTARGELAADERATIEIFERASPSVVFISTRQRVMNLWTRNIASVPRGNGSGMIWDGLGHVVTNNHVVEGASQAIVRLNDGRSYRATLIGASAARRRTARWMPGRDDVLRNSWRLPEWTRR